MSRISRNRLILLCNSNINSCSSRIDATLRINIDAEMKAVVEKDLNRVTEHWKAKEEYDVSQQRYQYDK